MEIRQRATVEVQVNGEDAKKELQSLESYANSLKGRLAEAYKAGDTKKIKQLEKELRETNAQLKVMRTNTKNIDAAMNNIGLATPKELRNLIRDINAKISSGHVKRGSAEWRKYQEQLKFVNAELRKVKSEVVESEGWLTRFNNGFTKWGALAASGIAAITGLTFTIRKATAGYADMEEAESQVIKYTGMTKEQVKSLNEDLKQMDTRTARERLNALAGDAGRLGKSSKKDVLEFIDAADKINVALGEDLGEDAVKNIGKLAMMFGEDKEKGLRGAMLATGSAINAVGQTSSAAEAYLVDFTARVAGAANQAKISQANIIGFASVLDQNMLRDETAATAFQNVMMKMYQEPAKFAKIAGKDVAEFTKLLKTDANEAILQFLQSLNKKGSLDQLAPLFDKMKLDGQGAASVLSVLAGKIEGIRVAQKTANEAYNEGTSIIDEFNVQNNTVQAGIDKSKKKFADLTIELGEKLLPLAQYGISTGSLTIKVLSSLIEFLGKYGKTIVYASLVLGTYIPVQKLQYLWTNKVKTAIIEYNAVQKLKLFWDKAVAASTWLYIAATSVLTGRLRQAKLAMQAFFLVTKFHPLGLLLTVITAVAGGIYLLATRTKKAKTLTEEFFSAISEERNELNKIYNQLLKTNEKTAERTRLINEFNSGFGKYLTNLLDEKSSVDDIKKAYKEATAAMNDHYARELLASKQSEIVKESLDEQSKALRKSVDIAINATKDQKARLSELINDVTNQVITDNPDYGAGNVRQKIYEQINREFGSGAAYDLFGGSQGWEDFSKEISPFIKAADKTINKVAKLKDELAPFIKNLSSSPVENSNDGSNDDMPPSDDLTDKEKQKILKENLKKVEAAAAKEEALIKANYSKGDMAYREYCKAINENDVKEFDNKMALYDKESNEYNQLLTKKQDLLRKGVEKENKFSLDEIEACARKEEMIWVDTYQDHKIDKYALNEALFMLDIAMLSDKQALYEKKSEEWHDYEKQITDRESEEKLRKQREFQELLSSFREEYSKKDLEQLMQVEIDGLDFLYKEKILKEEEYLRYLKVIKQKYAGMSNRQIVEAWDQKISEALQQAKDKAMVDSNNKGENNDFWGTLFGADADIHQRTMDNLNTMHEAGLIAQRSYLQAMANENASYFSELAGKVQMYYSEINGVVSSYSNFSQACSELEIAKIEKKYDVEIKAAGDNKDKVAKLEKEKDKAINAEKSKANKKATTIQIAQALAETAISALRAYSAGWEAGFPAGPILAPLFAGMAVASGMLQVATIRKQAQAQEAGYYSGGFTPLGDPKKEVGTVHASEFVANHKAVNNPNILPVLQLIDYAQKNNTVGSLTAKDISMSLDKGYSATPVSTSSTSSDENTTVLIGVMSNALDRASSIMEKLSMTLDEGIESYVTIDGEHGFEKQYNHYKKLKANKSRL